MRSKLKPLRTLFCHCIKNVRSTVKVRNKKSTKERAAIAICVQSVLQSRGKTLKKFRCGKKPYLLTQKPITRI